MQTNRSNISKVLLVIISLAAGVATGVLFAKNAAHQPSPTAGMNLPEIADLPSNAFDASVSIPNTSVKVSYPKAGFYGHGAIVANEPASPNDEFHSLGAVSVSPKVSSNEDRPEYLTVGAYAKTSAASLESSIDDGKVSGIVIGKHAEEGTYVTIGNHRFFVYKVLETSTLSAWHAVAFGKKEIVLVTFESSTGSDAASYTSSRNDDQLFFSILSHLSFE